MRMNRKSLDYQSGYSCGRYFGARNCLKRVKQCASDAKESAKFFRTYDHSNSGNYDYYCGYRDGLISQVKRKEKRMKGK